MSLIREFKSEWRDGKLGVDGIELSDLRDIVMAETPAVIRGVFREEVLASLRSHARRWGQETKRMPPQTYIDENFHAYESGVSPRQNTPHSYHAYNFNYVSRLPSYLREPLMAVCEPLRIFQNDLTGNNADYRTNEQGYKLHPQFIHYPCGGGMLGRHVHGLEPQRIGLILACSKRGKDFGRGSTYFEIDGEVVSSEEVHDIGDMLLFRFDQPHGISAIDDKDEFDEMSERGRWTFVLPYH